MEYPRPTCPVLFGTDARESKQFAVIGRTMDQRPRKVGLDLTATMSGCMLGAQGTGKSYSLGVIIESFITRIPGISHLPEPGCAMVFHYSRARSYKPEWIPMLKPNSNPGEVKVLAEAFQGLPQGAHDVVIVTPADLVEETKLEFPGTTVLPLLFHESEITVDLWIHLMGGADMGSIEMQVLLAIMSKFRYHLTHANLLKAVVEHEYLNKDQKYILMLRLSLVERFISKTDRLMDVMKPGRLIVLDMRDPFLDETTAFRLGLCVLEVFKGATNDGKFMSKLLAFDEAHEYARDPFLIDAMVRMVRLMRHLGLTILFASQDPPSLPKKVLELSSLIIMLGMETPGWMSYLGECKTQIGKIDKEEISLFKGGRSFMWTRACSDREFQVSPQRIHMRPRATMHGGETKKIAA